MSLQFQIENFYFLCAVNLTNLINKILYQGIFLSVIFDWNQCEYLLILHNYTDDDNTNNEFSCCVLQQLLNHYQILFVDFTKAFNNWAVQALKHSKGVSHMLFPLRVVTLYSSNPKPQQIGYQFGIFNNQELHTYSANRL